MLSEYVHLDIDKTKCPELFDKKKNNIIGAEKLFYILKELDQTRSWSNNKKIDLSLPLKKYRCKGRGGMVKNHCSIP